MSRRTLVIVASGTAAVSAAVVLSVDWSAPAIHDPARTLLLGPRESFVAAQGPHPPVFTIGELVLFLCSGLSFVFSGALVWRSRPRDLTGPLITLAGILWISGGIRRSGEPLLFTTGVVLTNLYLPLLIHMLLGFPSGRLRRSWERWFVASAWVLATAGVVCEWLFFDPRLTSPYRSTSDNLLLIRHDPALAEPIQLCVGAAAGLMGAVVLGVIAHRWRTGSPAFRTGFAPLAAACLLSAVATIWLLLAATRFPGSQAPWTYALRYPTTALLPIAVVWGLVRYRLAKGAISDAIVEIEEMPLEDGFVAALRRTLHDPTLALWLYDREREGYLDDTGQLHPLPVEGSGRVTVLERDGVPVAALIHDETLQSQPELLAAVRGATSLALEHDRLQEALRAQLVELRRSRERIVTAGDVQRRRIERDLHDGAQQRLVAAQLLVRRAMRTDDEEHRLELLSDGATELATALGELRELAQGVYPPVLADSGLTAALTSLAERAPVPVEITDHLRTRPPPQVELAAYYIAAEAVANASKHAHAALISIDLRRDAENLRLTVADDGCGGAVMRAGGGLTGLLDRTAALGGELSVESPEGAGTTVTVVLPCAVDDHGESRSREAPRPSPRTAERSSTERAAAEGGG